MVRARLVKRFSPGVVSRASAAVMAAASQNQSNSEAILACPAAVKVAGERPITLKSGWRNGGNVGRFAPVVEGSGDDVPVAAENIPKAPSAFCASAGSVKTLCGPLS